MKNSQKVKELINSLDIKTLQTTLESELQNQNFDFQTKLEWEGDKGTIYVEEQSTDDTGFALTVIEFNK